MTTVDERGPTLIQSLRRGLRLLESVVERGPATARELSRVTGIALPTTYHLLRTLVDEGYLDRIGGGAYAVGGQCRSAAELERSTRTVPALRGELRRLGEAAGTSICLAALEDDAVRLLHFIANPRAPRVDWWAGMALPAHATAVGKCVLAQLPAGDRSDFIDRHPLVQLTARTTVDRARLEDELTGCDVFRSSQEHAYGVASVATAVSVNATFGALGAIHSASATRSRARVEALLLQSADRLSELLARTDQLASNPTGPSPISRRRTDAWEPPGGEC
jgi:DNA-binding IclR family transcriptional regulator